MQQIRGIGGRRDYEAVLGVHEQQAPTLRDAVNIARGHCLAVDNVSEQEYQPARERKELKALTSATVLTLTGAIQAAMDRVPEPSLPPTPATDQGPTFDRFLHRLGIESTAAGVSTLLRESESAGLLDRLWPYAANRLRSFAADEQRRHAQPSPHSAFNLWSTWSARMTGGARSNGAATRAQGQRAVRERGLAIADVIGLRLQVEQRLRGGSVPEPSSTATGGGSGLVFGRFFEQE